MTKIKTYKSAAQTFIPMQRPDVAVWQNGQANIPSHDQIARRAFEIYVKTGRKQGQCKQNWYEAEEALRDFGRDAALEQSQSSPTSR